MPGEADIIWVGIALLFGGLFYLLPSIVAVFIRKTINQDGIIVVNVFLGWTFVGWVVALAWAMCDRQR